MCLSSHFKVRVLSALATLALILLSVPAFAQEHASRPSLARPKRAGHRQHGKHDKPAHDVGVGGLFLDVGPAVPPPQPRLFSRSSYTVVDVPTDHAPVTNFISCKPAAGPFVANAEEAFRSRSYDSALRWTQHAVLEDPQNGMLELFAAQAFFALGEYDAAADSIARAFSRLPQQQWNTIVANHHVFYRNGDYIMQMRQLEEFIGQHPEDFQAPFVRGYHFAFLGQREAALIDMNRVLAGHPDHRAAADLLKFLDQQAPGVNALPATPAPNPESAFELLPPLE